MCLAKARDPITECILGIRQGSNLKGSRCLGRKHKTWDKALPRSFPLLCTRSSVILQVSCPLMRCLSLVTVCLQTLVFPERPWCAGDVTKEKAYVAVQFISVVALCPSTRDSLWTYPLQHLLMVPLVAELHGRPVHSCRWGRIQIVTWQTW